MGGYGSGRRYGYNSSKTTTESQHRIDIRWLKKQCRLHPGITGSISWSRGDEQTGSICYRIEENNIMLNYRHRPIGGEWEPIEQSISFDRTSCNYGGLRTWFLCPRCWKRVAVLYGAGKYFFCRHCYDLTYGSQQEAQEDRLMRKARKIRWRLGLGDNIMEPILFKPKNMHQTTFDRLRREANDAENHGWIVAGQRFGIHF